MCYFHVGGNFEKSVEGGDKYCGGNIRSKSLQQGVTFEELKGLVGEWFNINDLTVLKKFPTRCV